MPIDATYLDADVAAVETEEAAIGSVVDVTLPDGVMIVRGIQVGASNSLSMEDAGYGDSRVNEVTIRASEFNRVGAALIPTARQEFLLRPVNQPSDSYESAEPKPWIIESVTKPDSTLYLFKLRQNP
jgi:hypothetical protein